MTDRACIRGCMRRDVHYASCDRHGETYTGEHPCRGCAPVECREGSLICDRCFGRMRGLLADVHDLLARLQSLADPMKATPTDKVPGGSRSAEPPAPVGADLLDAINAVRAASWWADEDLTAISNRADILDWLLPLVLDRHPEHDGVREAWSVQDAVDKWGVERRTDGEMWDADPEVIELDATPVIEWDRPLIGRDEAAKLAGSSRTLQRWSQKGLIAPAGEMYIAGVRTRLYLRDEVLKVKAEQEDVKAGRVAAKTQGESNGD